MGTRVFVLTDIVNGAKTNGFRCTAEDFDGKAALFHVEVVVTEDKVLAFTGKESGETLVCLEELIKNFKATLDQI